VAILRDFPVRFIPLDLPIAVDAHKWLVVSAVAVVIARTCRVATIVGPGLPILPSTSLACRDVCGCFFFFSHFACRRCQSWSRLSTSIKPTMYVVVVSFSFSFVTDRTAFSIRPSSRSNSSNQGPLGIVRQLNYALPHVVRRELLRYDNYQVRCTYLCSILFSSFDFGLCPIRRLGIGLCSTCRRSKCESIVCALVTLSNTIDCRCFFR
jgi:hypothetical protein